MPGSPAALLLVLALQAPSAADGASPVQAREPDRPVTHLFQNLVRDIVRLPSPGSALILAAGSAGSLGIRPVDDNLQTWAAEQGPANYTTFGRRLGDGWVQGGASLATYGVGLIVHRPAVTHLGSDLVRAQVLNALITRVTKAAVGRRRPGGSHDSFPSGHASATFASAAVLGEHFGWKAGIPAYAVAAYVGWTRVRDQAHWGTDVVIGATVGTIVGYTVSRGHRDHSWVLLPAASPRQASLTVVWTPGPR